MNYHLYYTNSTQRGPGKVVKNLEKGLQLADINYSVNTPFNEILEDDKIFCLQTHEILNTSHSKKAVIGPNICVIPPENQTILNRNYRQLVVPCEWVKKMWSPWVSPDDITIWPVGVDTLDFTPSEKKKTIDCLIYYKNRGTNELNVVEQFLQSKGLKYVIIHYGHYDEENFKSYLSLSKFCFMLDNTESQGIATLEIMSSGLPIFVWDTTVFNNPHYPQIKADYLTSVPYWDDRCGIKYFGGDQLENKFNQFLDNLDKFNPRQYVIENLDLKTQAKKLIDL